MACGSASESDVYLVTTLTISVCKWDLLEFVCDSFVSHFDWLIIKNYLSVYTDGLFVLIQPSSPELKYFILPWCYSSTVQPN